MAIVYTYYHIMSNKRNDTYINRCHSLEQRYKIVHLTNQINYLITSYNNSLYFSTIIYNKIYET